MQQSENIFGSEERLGNLAEAEYASGDLRARSSISKPPPNFAATDVVRSRGGAVRRAPRGILRAGRRLRFGAYARRFGSDEGAGALGWAFVAATFGVVRGIFVSRLWR